MKIAHRTRLWTLAAATALVVTVIGAGAFAAPAANAAEQEVAPIEETTLRDARAFLAEYGVDAATQDRLISRYLAGDAWDSFSSESSVVREETNVDEQYEETVRHYADGSVAVTRLELPKTTTDGIGSRSAPNGCAIGSNGARTNCNVDMWVGLISMGFKANYNLNTNTVSSVWGASWTIGGSCSSSQVYLGRPSSSIGLLAVSAQQCAIPYSTTFNLQVQVSAGNAVESWW